MRDVDPAFKEFIVDRSKKEFHLIDPPYHEFHFFKFSFDEEIDVFYFIRYADYTSLANLGNPTYAGVYSHSLNKWFDVPYLAPDEMIKQGSTFGKFQASFEEAVSAKILELVHGSPIEDVSKSLEYPVDINGFETFTLPRCAKRYFMGDLSLGEFQVDYTFGRRFAQDTLRFLSSLFKDFDKEVEYAANEYISRHANEINFRLYATKRTKEEAAKLETTPGVHHIQREIMRSVANEKIQSVVMTIERSSAPMSFKYDVKGLRGITKESYSWQYVKDPFFLEYTERFGRNDIIPTEILKIEYNKKVLYSKADDGK